MPKTSPWARTTCQYSLQMLERLSTSVPLQMVLQSRLVIINPKTTMKLPTKFSAWEYPASERSTQDAYKYE